jgi:hypothetical protein
MALIHITPQFVAPQDLQTLDLVDITCTELGLNLKNGQEVTVRRPWQNKKYRVVCRKTGQKAISGIMVERREIPKEFTVVTRWTLQADDILTHTVRYLVTDTDFDFVSDQISMWGRSGCMTYPSRVPTDQEYGYPAETQPQMGLVPYENRKGLIKEEPGVMGLLIGRHETLHVPTLERSRLERYARADRLPDPSLAF